MLVSGNALSLAKSLSLLRRFTMGAVLVLLVLCTTVHADVLFVAETGGTHSDLRQAIDHALGGDILVVDQDFAFALSLFESVVTISGKGLTIVGLGSTESPSIPPPSDHRSPCRQLRGAATPLP
ncbi:MAG: hypothetical protein ACI9EF_002262 [Pseudohongiellaceae bacterium]|jgi:hypothetical protein